MKKIFAMISLMSLLMGCQSLASHKPLPKWSSLAQHFVTADGNVTAYPGQTDTILLESIGQQLEILLALRDRSSFAQTVAVLKRDFVVSRDNDTFLKWKKGSDVNVNALIDDLRIAAVLQTASQQFKQADYRTLSQNIVATILRYQLVDGALVEYYDWFHQQRAQTVQLSYLHPDWLKQLNFPDSTWVPLLNATDTPFFVESYNIETKTWVPLKNEEVNLIDQLLIADNRLRLQYESPRFNRWLSKQATLYGRYERNETPKRTVSYTSLSVNSLAWHYAKLRNHTTLMKRYKAGIQLPTSHWNDVHFFDVAYAYLTLLESRKTP